MRIMNLSWLLKVISKGCFYIPELMAGIFESPSISILLRGQQSVEVSNSAALHKPPSSMWPMY